MYDAVVIGGGFYGCAIAIYLKKTKKLKNVCLIEQRESLMKHASYNNQARVHNGYHYPRSFTTAYRSRINFPKFLKNFDSAIESSFEKIYAVGSRHSKVNAKQYARFCKEIGAKLSPVDKPTKLLFNSALIEDLFKVEEVAFNADILRQQIEKEIKECGVEVLLNHSVINVQMRVNFKLLLQGRDQLEMDSNYIFNCTYSGLNQVQKEENTLTTRLKHEITEMALVEVPDEFQKMGITVMDGPFFSIMPFPARNLHTLSHVRYTPHLNWVDEKGENPYLRLQSYSKETRFENMKRDAARYVPKLSGVKYQDSLFEIKTVLVKNEVDDGRPILFEPSASSSNLISILGGKIDNIYDIYEKLDRLDF